MPEVAGALHGQRTRSCASMTVARRSSPWPCRSRHDGDAGGAPALDAGGDIDQVIAAERWANLRFFLVLAAVMLVLSLSLANTIAEPVRRLADAAERVRRGIRSREQIPDFTWRAPMRSDICRGRCAR